MGTKLVSAAGSVFLHLTFLGLYALPFTAEAKGVSFASELGPYDFLSYIESSNGAILDISDQSTTLSAVEIVDPVIAGIQISGIITADAQMTFNGPATWVNVELRMVDDRGIDLALIDVVSEVRYNLAAFGSTDEAQVRIVANGIKNNVGNILGLTTRAGNGTAANIELYETDVFGNRADLAQLWQPITPSPSGTPGAPVDEELTFTNFGQSFLVNTNQLYEVVVHSSTRIVLGDIESFDLKSYAFMSPLFESETEGAKIAVSSFENPSLVIASPPGIFTSRVDGISTEAIISGGVRLAGSTNYSENFVVGDSIIVDATLQPEPEDIGKLAEVFVVATSGDGQFQITADGLATFDGTEANLMPFSEVSLRAVTKLDLLTSLGEQAEISEADVGGYEIYVGYATEGSTITYTGEPILLEVSIQ